MVHLVGNHDPCYLNFELLYGLVNCLGEQYALHLFRRCITVDDVNVIFNNPNPNERYFSALTDSHFANDDPLDSGLLDNQRKMKAQKK